MYCSQPMELGNIYVRNALFVRCLPVDQEFDTRAFLTYGYERFMWY